MQLFFVLYNVLSTVVCLSTPFCLGTKRLIIVAFRNLIYEYSIIIFFPKNVFKYFHGNDIFLKPPPQNTIIQKKTKNKSKQNKTKKTKQRMDVSYQSGLSFNTFVFPTSIYISFIFKSLSSLGSYHTQLHCFHRNITNIDIFFKSSYTQGPI